MSLAEYNSSAANRENRPPPGEEGIDRRSRLHGTTTLDSGIANLPQYSSAAGHLDAMRREFIASAIALSHVPGGLEVLRVPLHALLRPGGSRHYVDGDGASLDVQLPIRMGCGFNSASYGGALETQRAAGIQTLPRSNTSVRAGWRPPVGYLGVVPVKVPAVTQFTTKSNAFAPRPPGDRSLHWNTAAGAHAGAVATAGGGGDQAEQVAKKPQRPPSAATQHLLLQQVNLDVAAVLADQTFADEQAEQQRAANERRRREFGQVMKERLNPAYQSGVDVANSRPASARIRTKFT
jgi:hypothetical protein